MKLVNTTAMRCLNKNWKDLYSFKYDTLQGHLPPNKIATAIINYHKDSPRLHPDEILLLKEVARLFKIPKQTHVNIAGAFARDAISKRE